MGGWVVRPLILIAAILALVSPRVLGMRAVWFSVTLAVASRIASDWPLADNHIYLTAYWLLAITLSLGAADSAAALALNSRRLIGLAFAFAVLWKAVLSPDFLDGRFFRVTLLTDPRFGEAAMLVGGLTADELEANRRALDPMPEGAELLDPAAVVEPARLRALAALSTWGMLLLEAAVAVVMLLPAPRLAMARHSALLLFCLITYAFAPVAGFGWLLLLMGVAQIDPGQAWLHRIYVAAFAAVLFFDEVPWAGLLLDYGT
jgi:hypothetical protein